MGIWRSQIQRQMVEQWLPGAEGGGNGELLSNGYSFNSARWKSSGDLFHDNVSEHA